MSVVSAQAAISARASLEIMEELAVALAKYSPNDQRVIMQRAMQLARPDGDAYAKVPLYKRPERYPIGNEGWKN